MRRFRWLVLGLLSLMVIGSSWAQAPEVRVGSKKFTEGVLLGELLTHLARDAGAFGTHRRELGGTQILWQALRAGEIDVYAEYTGTLTEEIFAGRGLRSEAGIREALAAEGLEMSAPLGFNNTYAIGMQRELAESLALRTISDLRRHPELRFGFNNEFMDRGDGWPSLRERYALPQQDVRGIDHDLAYRGLVSGSIDAMDLYSTDAEIAYYDLHVLEDDLRHFPEYRAVVLYRRDLEERAPEVVESMLRLAGRITPAEMVAMNARAKIDRVPESEVAADFLRRALSVTAEAEVEGTFARLLRLTREHLFLVGVSLLAAILVSVPLGVLAARYRRLGQVILGTAGVLQTIPSLALLVFMIPLLGIGVAPSLAALFLYSLLPIVRNTHSGLQSIPGDLRASAEALGLSSWARLRLIELPMASRSILAGVKTSAVINIGTATLGALIGAGGFGEPILTGIRLDDISLILQGAVPAAGLALAAQGTFDMAERWIVPKGLRI